MNIDIYLFKLFSDSPQYNPTPSPQAVLDKWAKAKGVDQEIKVGETPPDYKPGAGLKSYLEILAESEGFSGQEALHAQVLSTLCGDDFFAALHYLADYAKQHPGTQMPIHAACSFELPVNQKNWIKLDIWRALAKKFKYEKWFMEILFLAREIEQESSFNQQITKDKLLDIALNKQYSPEFIKQNPMAAKIFMQHRVSKEKLQLYLTMKPLDDFKSVPDLCLRVSFPEGKEISKPVFEEQKTIKQRNKKKKTKKEKLNLEFTIERLASNEPEAAILGILTGCCQYVGNRHGGHCTEHGITNPNGGFYVIRKHGKIVAQVWVWRSGDALVFDSIEANQAVFGKKSKLLNTLFRGLANHIVEKTDLGIKRVLVGVGGRTPKNCGISLSSNKPLISHHHHTDAVYQRQLSITFNDFRTQLEIKEEQFSEEDFPFIDHIKTLDQWIIFVYYFKIDNIEHSLWPKLLEILDSFLVSQDEEEFYETLLRLLQPLSPQQCKAVCESKAIQNKLSTMLKNIGIFCSNFLTKLDEKSCKAVCESKEVSNLFPKLLKTTGDFLALIIRIEDTQLEEILELKPIQDKLQEILKTVTSPKEIIALIGKQPNKAKLILKTVQNKLVTFIETAKDFFDIMASLEPAQQQEIYKLVQVKLPALIKTPIDFFYLMKFLKPSQQQEIYKIAHVKLPGLTETSIDFFYVMKFLKPAQQQQMYNRVQVKFPKLIKTVSDFDCIMDSLTNLELREEIYQTIEEKLPVLINNSTDFATTLVHLEPTQCKAICELKEIQTKLSKLIATADDFFILIRPLPINAEKFKQILEIDTIRQRLRSVINTLDDFKKIKVGINLNQEKRHLFFKLILDKLPALIQTKEDFWEVIGPLNSDQRQFVLKAIPDKLSTLIQTKEEFWDMMGLITPDLRETIFHSMKNSLSENIKKDLLFDLLNHFQSDQYQPSDPTRKQFEMFLMNSLGDEKICSPSLMIEIVADLDSKSCDKLAGILAATKDPVRSAGFFPVSCPSSSMLAYILAIRGDRKDIVSQYCQYVSEKHIKIPEEIIAFTKAQSKSNAAAQNLLEFEFLQDWNKVMCTLLTMPNLDGISPAVQVYLREKQAVLIQEWMKWVDSQPSDNDKLALLHDLFAKKNGFGCIVSLDAPYDMLPKSFFWRPRTRSIGTEIMYRYSPLLKQLAELAPEIAEIGLIEPRDPNSLRRNILNALSDQDNLSFRFCIDRCAMNPLNLAGCLDALHDEFIESSETKQHQQAKEACYNLASHPDSSLQKNLAFLLGEDFARIQKNPAILASLVAERKQSFRKQPGLQEKMLSPGF